MEKDHIIEMACIITDGDLRVIEEVSTVRKKNAQCKQPPFLC